MPVSTLTVELIASRNPKPPPASETVGSADLIAYWDALMQATTVSPRNLADHIERALSLSRTVEGTSAETFCLTCG